MEALPRGSALLVVQRGPSAGSRFLLDTDEVVLADIRDPEALRAVFAGAREARQVLRDVGHPADELSMGMSNDYEVAVEEGSTMIRLGTALFGVRDA